MESLATSMTRDETIEQTIRTERRRLLEFIRSRVRIPEDAEDILQDVFYQFVAGEGVMGPVEKATSWLFTVARNKIIDLYRKRKPETLSRLRSDANFDKEPLLLEEILLDPEGDPDDVYFRALVREELAEALDELPPAQREVFVMHELEGKSFKEISEATGVSVPTLLSRKRYAVAYLRQQLQEFYDEL